MADPYPQTVAEMMSEAAADLEYPTSLSEVVNWFAEHNPQVKESTIRAHIVGLTDNDRNRHHYASLARRDPLLKRHDLAELEVMTQYEIDGGRLDALLKAESLVLVIENKLGSVYGVGQLRAYVGWLATEHNDGGDELP